MTVYLDHAATSPMPRAVIEAMWPYLTDQFANPASRHEAGQLAAGGLEAARVVVARALGGRPGEVVLTSGGTEGDNLAVKGVALASQHGRRIVTTTIEHEAVLESCDYLERRHGFQVTRVPVDGTGLVDLGALARALTGRPALCSVHYAHNEIGTVQPVAGIAALCRAAGVPLHVDAVQAAGLLPCAGLGADLVTISGHKFGGPKGTGALLVRAGLPLEPLLHGGGQERGARSGTGNVAGAVGLAAALHLAERDRVEVAGRLTLLRDRLIDGVLALGARAVLTGHRTRRLPNHASFCFPGRSGESVLVDLEAAGIACSSGSACAAGSQEPSPVLLATGLDPRVAETAVRFTLGRENTGADVDAVLAALRRIL